MMWVITARNYADRSMLGRRSLCSITTTLAQLDTLMQPPLTQYLCLELTLQPPRDPRVL
jgi:hypothetical protein